MKENKYRYMFKQIIHRDISFHYLTLKEIEEGAVIKILQSGMIENGYILIAKDLFTGFLDKNEKELYEGDTVKGEYECLMQTHSFIGEIVYCISDGCWVIDCGSWSRHLGAFIQEGQVVEKIGDRRIN